MKKVFFLAVSIAISFLMFAQQATPTTPVPQVQNDTVRPVKTIPPKPRIIYRDRIVEKPVVINNYYQQQPAQEKIILTTTKEDSNDFPWIGLLLAAAIFAILYLLLKGAPNYEKSSPQYFYMYGGKGGEGGRAEANAGSKNTSEHSHRHHYPHMIFVEKSEKKEEKPPVG